jgi:hypothetical protein
MSKLETLDNSYLNKRYKLLGFEEEIHPDTFLPIQLTGVDQGFANALRRIFTEEVPTAAFNPDDVVIRSNTSQYHQEVLVDRVGFITLDTGEITKAGIDKLLFLICDPEDPSRPLKNEGEEILKVHLHDYMYIQNTETKAPIDVESIVPHDSLLLTLNPGEEIHLLMQASMGTGRVHPRWQSSVAMYKFVTEHDGTPKLETNDEQLDYLGKDHRKPESIILTVESIDKLPSSEIIGSGFDVFKQKLDFIKQHITLHEDSDIVTLTTDDSIPNLVQYTIKDEDQTLGIALQRAILNNLEALIKTTVAVNEQAMASEESERNLLQESMSSFRKPHPLDNYIELVVRTPQTYDLVFPSGKFDEFENPAVRLVIYTIESMKDLCDDLLSQFN